MDEGLTGHVEPYRRDGRTQRGRWRLVVNLPRIASPDGRHWSYPRQTRTVDASGVKDAGKQLQRWIAELEQQRTRDPQLLTLGQLLERWQAGTAHELKPKTRRFYRENVEQYVLPARGSAPSIASLLAARVRPSDLTRLYAALREGGLSETTCRHVHNTLHACYAWALREELLEANPCDRVKRRQVPKPMHRSLVTWDEETIGRALSLAVERRKGREPRPLYLVQVPLVLAAWSGLRAVEVAGLRRTDVDLEAGVVTVRRNVYWSDGELYVGPPKSEAGLRSVPLPRQSAAVLREYLRLGQELRLAHRGRWNPDGYVLCSGAGLPLDPNRISATWSRFVRSRELPPLTFHGLRHSFATNMFEQAPGHEESMLKVVQKLLGHADPAITARIYLHATEHALDAVAEEQQRRIDAAMEQVSHNDRTRAAELSGRRNAK